MLLAIVASLFTAGGTMDVAKLHFEDYVMPAATLGPDDPLPAFRGMEEGGKFDLNDNVPEDDRRYMGWHTAWRVLPYRMQDSYTRERQPRAFHAIILENECLKAIFLPELGGRLISLYQKKAGRELLDKNPVFQPSNLALRNAWFSGGIEWNAGGVPGHHYLTCSPVYAARAAGPGYDVLRLYEWERIKCFCWQIDFHLPPGSPFLFARARLVNPHDHEIPMYWWTNMAVPEQAGARVLFPAKTAIGFCDNRQMGLVQLPFVMGKDASYATNVPFAQEMFSRIDDSQRHWVAQLDSAGKGLLETSTDRLRGRKMFCWGMNQGGRRWQEFLSVPGQAYVEIQAGLARTQLECLPMPAKAEWTWTEAFGLLEADAEKVHGSNWSEAWQCADATLERALPRQTLEDNERRFTEFANDPPREILWRGYGWGRVEAARLAKQGRPPLPEALTFDGEPSADQRMWLMLLETGALPERDAQDDPGETLTQPEWQTLLEQSLAQGKNDNWLAWYHLGVMRLENCDPDGAREAWEKSLACHVSGWALRNLAVLAERRGDKSQQRELLRQAWETGPKIVPLALEYAHALVEEKDYQALRTFVKNAPDDVRNHERMQVMSAQAAMEQGDLDEVARLFDKDFATNREGEVTLTDLWFAWHEKQIAARENVPIDKALKRRVRREFPPPARIDFRMVSEIE